MLNGSGQVPAPTVIMPRWKSTAKVIDWKSKQMPQVLGIAWDLFGEYMGGSIVMVRPQTGWFVREHFSLKWLMKWRTPIFGNHHMM